MLEDPEVRTHTREADVRTTQHARRHEHLRRPPLSERSRRVIVAEDSPDIRQVVAIALRSLGYETVEASSGAELLDQLADAVLSEETSLRPHLIVSDIRMPGLTGLEILAGLRQAGWNTYIVLMTAYADTETRAEACRLGADALFAKPFEIDDLLTVVINMPPLSGAPRVWSP
jgi:CheY-like chemotaxis protein